MTKSTKRIVQYPMLNPQGKHVADIDISILSIDELREIYAAGYCIVTTKLNERVNQLDAKPIPTL